MQHSTVSNQQSRAATNTKHAEMLKKTTPQNKKKLYTISLIKESSYRLKVLMLLTKN